MATIPISLSSLRCSVCSTTPVSPLPSPSPSLLNPPLCRARRFPSLRSRKGGVYAREAIWVVRAAEVEEASATSEEEEGQQKAGEDSPSEQQPVSVQVSPSDTLTMFFKAEGTMDASAESVVYEALEKIEGISDCSVRVVNGLASVELTKETTVQATGVGSNLVEIIQGKGFKLQTLSLSFDDGEEPVKTEYY